MSTRSVVILNMCALVVLCFMGVLLATLSKDPTKPSPAVPHSCRCECPAVV